MSLKPIIINEPFINTTSDFWPTMLDMSFMRGTPIKQKIKNYSEMVAHFSQVSRDLPSTYPSVANREYYDHEFWMDTEGKFHYQLTWDIDKLKDIIQQTKHPVVKLRYTDIMKHFDMNSLNAAYLSPAYDNPEPVIVAHVSVTNSIIILDGNHRVMRGFNRNPSGAINAYWLEATDHLPGLADPVFSTLFKLHHNVNVMANYMAGNIRKMKYNYKHHNQSLYEV
ncbi:hypothetical protein B2I21_36255 [Chryseobacterium mucoviscidosis]|nr:hypothetical protein B2I21_36255 [Chryseobacterium mucoviscidosis]